MSTQEAVMTRDDAIERLSTTPRLLVAVDYDGTLAPIVSDPAKAYPDRRSVIALRALADLPHTTVVVISGRALSDLSGFLPGLDGVHMVGSHGSEFDAGFADQLPAEKRETLREIRKRLKDIAERYEGVAVEEKPASVALHTRNADDGDGAAAIDLVEQGPVLLDGVTVKRGKEVIELCVVETDKGKALQLMRQRSNATTCVFIGDDVTDEDAFRSMHGPDLGIKVGHGETAASLRVESPAQVAQFLARLHEARSKWLTGSACVPIEQHSMLSDQRSIALVTPSADITWLCAPAIDSPALFADLLGGPSAGHWSVGPADGTSPVGQMYIGASMSLMTQFSGMRVIDYLDCSDGQPALPPGRLDLVRSVEGSGKVRIEFAPRLSYGQIHTYLKVCDDGLVVQGSHDQVVLRAPGVEWEIEMQGDHHTAVGIADLDAGALVMELRFGTDQLGEHRLDETGRREETQRYWEDLANSLRLPERYREPVERSALLLRALCFGPSGGIAAAGTTSLPELIGGVRNWDYRYCWPRDAAMSASALVRLGSFEEAYGLLMWMRGVLEGLPSPDALAPIYTVGGEPLGPEAEISELSGYAGSRPVRIGNAAASQLQLDVFGPVVELVGMLQEHGAPLDMWHWELVESLADVVVQRWSDPDHGIWEPRIPPRHHVHSKTMCWMALDRARRIGTSVLGTPPTKYDALIDEIRSQILERGWNDELSAFTDAYGTHTPDAATLWTGLSGMLKPDDELFRKNVASVDRELRQGAAVFRYFHDDGLPGDEGGFNLCTAWLIESFAMIGEREKAEELFERYLALAGQTGLMSEEHDPNTGQALGNVPQAYSHLGVINAALSLQ